MKDIYSGLLKMNEEFEKGLFKCKMKYELEADYSELLAKYDLNTVVGSGTDYEKARRLLEWESTHVKHKGNYDGHVRNVAMDLFEFSFDKEEGINCRSLSIALAECFLAVGMKAHVVYMYPCSPYECDNHVVCEVWISELGKWVMLDPTYNCIVLDKDNNPLNILEIRLALANLEELHIEDGFNYNGGSVSENEILEYYAKDMFWFSVYSIQGRDSENVVGRKQITIAPKNFDAKKYQLQNVDYRIACWGSYAGVEEWKKQLQADVKIYSDFSVLYD